MIALSKKAGLAPSTMTGLLDRMERDELVARTTDPTDRRALKIHLTKIGRQVRNPVVNMVDRVITKVFAGITQDDISQIKNLLRHVLTNANAENRT